jgi:cyanophycinase
MLIPKGKLISIGGNEDKGNGLEHIPGARTNINFQELDILKCFLAEMQGPGSKVEVITTASLIPEEVGEVYAHAFSRLGCSRVNLMHIKSREDARNPEFLDRLREADGVLFTGGNQLRLSMIFGGSEFLKVLNRRYQEDSFVIAGTSAGAMAMSNTMIIQGDNAEALLKGGVKITTGFGLIKDVIIDTHFVARGRFGRLAEAVAANPGCIGIGLGDDTGLLIRDGNRMEAIGSGLVVIMDGHDIGHSNIADINFGAPLSIQNLVMHIMAKGNSYLLKERSFCATSGEAESEELDNVYKLKAS